MNKLRIAIVLAALVVMIGVFPFSAGAAGKTMSKKALFRKGARLWPVYCAQCHKARPGGEFSPRQWETLILHMRTRANMPAQDARAILQYLKAR